jgi:hypothetical protein
MSFPAHSIYAVSKTRKPQTSLLDLALSLILISARPVHRLHVTRPPTDALPSAAQRSILASLLSQSQSVHAPSKPQNSIRKHARQERTLAAISDTVLKRSLALISALLERKEGRLRVGNGWVAVFCVTTRLHCPA